MGSDSRVRGADTTSIAAILLVPEQAPPRPDPAPAPPPPAAPDPLAQVCYVTVGTGSPTGRGEGGPREGPAHCPGALRQRGSSPLRLRCVSR